MQDTDMIGQTISHYQILEKLGEGGMGVVYKAEDTRLKRTVALKFLPPHLSASEQDKARFSQEAQAASAINHPNICTIHDIQDHDNSMFIVMEFVEGQTLRDLAGPNRDSPLQMKRAIEIGIQVADGLAAAHEKGIVHRDVKPENIMVRKDGIVQIMDFGLAKLRGVSRLTREGSTVGTAGYMSPEQVQGQDADHRSDIFSLGVLLYEMFTGQLPFKGVHETALMYEIVNVDATPMVAARPEIDPALDAIVLECLEKDPNERTQSVKQVSIDLKRFRRESGRQRASRITRTIPVMNSNDSMEALSGQTEVRTKMPRYRIGLAAGVVLAVVASVLGFSVSFLLSPEKETIPVVRASLEMPPGVSYWDGVGGHSAISPDGSRVVFAALDSLSQNRLWLLQLKSGVSHPLTGTDNATYPFWSPDSRFIGFFAEGKVKTIEADGGPTLVLANAPFGRGGAWSPGGEIVFSPSVSDRNLYAVSASGGATRVVTRLDSTANIAPRFPFFLPSGNQYLFSVIDLGPQNSARIHVGSFDNVESKALLEGVSYAGFASGYLFYLRQGVLMAQPFDPGSLSFNGAPLQVQGNINAWPARAKADYSVSSNGVLVYSAGMGGREKDFFWTTTDGVETPVFRSETFTTAVLSPHATHIAYDAIDEQGRKVVIWVYEISGKRKMRLTFTEKSVSRPVWSRDGLRLYFHIEVDASKANIGFKRSDGSGNEEIIARGDAGESVGYYPSDVSSDGRFLLLHLSNESSSELAVIDLTGKEKILPVRKLGIRGREGQFSPDGKWIVYESNESGIDQVYVSSSSGEGGKWQISTEGGTGPLWLRNEIIYYAPGLSRHERVTAAYSSGTPVFGKPQTVFPPGKDANTFVRGMSEDGKRYFAFRPVAGGSTKRLSMIVNWQGLVKQN